MISLQTFRELYDWSYWARDRQLAVCETLRPEQFLAPTVGSFSCVRDTLVHMIGAEWAYQHRWRGRSVKPTDDDAQDYLLKRFDSVQQVRERWLELERVVREYLATVPQETLAEPLTYVNLQGDTWTYPLWRVILNLVTHQAYHRGQLTNQLRELGGKPLAVDFLIAHDLNFQTVPQVGGSAGSQ